MLKPLGPYIMGKSGLQNHPEPLGAFHYIDQGRHLFSNVNISSQWRIYINHHPRFTWKHLLTMAIWMSLHRSRSYL